MDTSPTIVVTSTAFAEGGHVPAAYTCDGANSSPPLAWHDVPGDAVALALVVDDPDAPGGTFTHWVVVDVDPRSAGVDEDSVPVGGVTARNSARRASYFGPCPPGGTHRYRFTVHALSSVTGLAPGAALDEALGAIASRSVAWGRLTATYTRA
jgi:Raf kinase inhibitor-like YbhB/YbcL family protein